MKKYINNISFLYIFGLVSVFSKYNIFYIKTQAFLHVRGPRVEGGGGGKAAARRERHKPP